MRKSMMLPALCLLAILIFPGCYTVVSQSLPKNTTAVKVAGAMKNVMWQGQLHGTISLDTITPKQHLYGLGPTAYLAGEILIMDGRSYKATVLSDTAIQVEETYDIEAPFFVYAHVSQWREQPLPDSILTMQQLEQYINIITETAAKPFAFKLAGEVKQARIHVVNLPEGIQVKTPSDAHQGRQYYTIQQEQVQIIGFFSTTHQGIFTHHDTFLHMHLITGDQQKMGHLDEILLEKGKVKLYLPYR